MRDPSGLPEGAAEGSILPTSERDCYWVRGKTGWYWNDAAAGTCSCLSYFWRGHPTRPCKHLKILAGWLARRKETNGTRKRP